MNTKFEYRPEKQITALCLDDPYLWLSYKRRSDFCHLHQVEASSPDVKLVDIELDVDEITSLCISGDYLYVGMEDDIYLAKQIHKTTTSTATWINLPAGITEKVVDIVADSNYIYFLIAGSPTKIVIIQKSDLSYITTISLTKSGTLVENAKKIDIDFNGDIWVVSNLSTTSVLTKVFLLSGLFYDFTSWTLS
jgi:hypothetical protein